MKQLLEQLKDRMNKAFGNRLVSLVLYGSAAAEEYDSDFSDLNILCVLTRVTTEELTDSEPVFHWWRQQRNPAPLLLSEEEVKTSADCFPIEFHDMQERRVVLAGTDVIGPLEIHDTFYRAQVEYQLRSKLLRLRQKAAGIMGDRELLARLMADSVSTFVMLFRHALRLGGHPPLVKREEIIAEVEKQFQVDAQTLLAVLALRQKSAKPKNTPMRPLLEDYIAQISKVVEAVDRIEQ